MTLFEAIVVVVALVVAGAVAIVNGSLDPVVAGIIGIAVGYGGKGAVAAAPQAGGEEAPFKGAPDA